MSGWIDPIGPNVVAPMVAPKAVRDRRNQTTPDRLPCGADKKNGESIPGKNVVP